MQQASTGIIAVDDGEGCNHVQVRTETVNNVKLDVEAMKA